MDDRNGLRKVLAERWVNFDSHDSVVFIDRGPGEPYREGLRLFGGDSGELAARARLVAAAPTLVRALLLTEWRPLVGGRYCPACSRGDASEFYNFDCHAIVCPVDAALTQAGLPDQQARDRAREFLKMGNP